MRSQLFKLPLCSARNYSMNLELCQKQLPFEKLRASTDDPVKLTPDDVAKIYQLKKRDMTWLQFDQSFPRTFKTECQTFGDWYMMCRKPYFEVVNAIKAVSPTVPAIKVVLWGKHGTGKTMTWHQGLHYAWKSGFICITMHNALDIARQFRGIRRIGSRKPIPSVYKENRMDTPYWSQYLLKLFKTQNYTHWKTLHELKTERLYTWTNVEKTEEGSPLTDLVEAGLKTTHIATDCYGALLRELRRYTNERKLKLCLAVDHANAMYDKTRLTKLDGRPAKPEEVSIFSFYRKFFTTEQCNMVCLLVADKRVRSHYADALTIPLDTPQELFGEKGIEELDPFLPIEMQNYTEEEIETIYNYYRQQKWLVNPKALTREGKLQLQYLADFNPFDFERLCAMN